MPPKQWISKVKTGSAASFLHEDIFNQSPPIIAKALVAAAKRAKKPNPTASAMRMLQFYINRAGSNLSPEDRDRLEAVKPLIKKTA